MAGSAAKAKRSGACYPASQHDSPHARIYDRHVKHPAWRALSNLAFRITAEMLAEYRPNAPNCFPAGAARIAETYGVAQPTAKKAIDELIDRGFLREERKGRASGPVATRERMVSLTRWDTETHAGDPELPIKVWRKRANTSNEALEHPTD